MKHYHFILANGKPFSGSAKCGWNEPVHLLELDFHIFPTNLGEVAASFSRVGQIPSNLEKTSALVRVSMAVTKIP